MKFGQGIRQNFSVKQVNDVVSNFRELSEMGVISHPRSKTITEGDNHQFCMMTMNHHPLHTNHEFAEKSGFGQPVVVGTLVFSLAVGMTVEEISSGCIANLGYADVKHHAPVFHGDTIRCKTKVLESRLSRKDSGKGIITVETHVFNQNDDVVMTFSRSMLFEVNQ